MAFDLTRVLRALLFASTGPLSIKDIQAVFTRFHEQAPEPAGEAEPVPGGDDLDPAATAAVAAESGDEPVPGEPAAVSETLPARDEVPSLITATQIREAMDTIARQLTDGREVYRLIEGHNGYRLVTSPDSAEWVRLLRNEPRPVKLSQAALETLAIVAYRQPVVRAEIEGIRGVSVDNALNRLLERELIQIVGRADLPGRPIQYGTSDVFLEFVGIKSIDELPASDVLSPREIDAWLRRSDDTPEVADREVGLDEENEGEAGENEPDGETAAGGDPISAGENENANAVSSSDERNENA